MRYLTAEEVIALHDREIPQAGIRDRDLLESAVSAPQQGFGGHDAHPTLHLKAAALLRGIAANHAFVDGNKRCALLATYAFYGLNGHILQASDTELVHLILDVVVDHWPVEKIGSQLERWAAPIPEPSPILQVDPAPSHQSGATPP